MKSTTLNANSVAIDFDIARNRVFSHAEHMGTDMTELKERMTEIEIRITRQDDLIDQLNEVIYAQQKEIDRLNKKLETLEKKIDDQAAHRNEKPPLY